VLVILSSRSKEQAISCRSLAVILQLVHSWLCPIFTLHRQTTHYTSTSPVPLLVITAPPAVRVGLLMESYIYIQHLYGLHARTLSGRERERERERGEPVTSPSYMTMTFKQFHSAARQHRTIMYSVL